MTRTFLAEWAPQWGVLLAWPHADTDWADNLAAAEQCYTNIVHSISCHGQVLLLCQDDTHQQHIEQCLGDISKVHFVQLPYNDTWARDFGFLTLQHAEQTLLVDFTFNAWGNKFAAHWDNALNQQLCQHPLLAHNPYEHHNLVLEGGSLESDGQGTLLTTRICLLNPNRNPQLNQVEIEQQLQHSLGVERILWLTQGHLEGDDTDAHIDTLARFASPEKIIYMSCDDPSDTHYPALQAMERELQALRQADGSAYQLYPVPLPAPIYAEGQRLPASYVNFLILNQAVLLPIYGDQRTDAIAIQQTQAAFPAHEIIPIDCNALIQQNGSLHCITMQIPQIAVGGG